MGLQGLVPRTLLQIENNVILNKLSSRAFHTRKDENAIADSQYLDDETSNVLKRGGNVSYSVKPYTPSIQNQGEPHVEVLYIPRPIPPGYK